DLQVILYLAKSLRRQRRPAEAVGRHELRGDAVEHARELVDAAKARQLRVHVDVDEPGRDDQAGRIDDLIRRGGVDAVDSRDAIACYTDIEAGARRTRAVHDLAALDQDVEVHLVKLLVFRF